LPDALLRDLGADHLVLFVVLVIEMRTVKDMADVVRDEATTATRVIVLFAGVFLVGVLVAGEAAALDALYQGRATGLHSYIVKFTLVFGGAFSILGATLPLVREARRAAPPPWDDVILWTWSVLVGLSVVVGMTIVG
jgi:hypothetical protein